MFSSNSWFHWLTFFLILISLLILNYGTILGRGKPGWGKESTRPPWWPGEVPWANVRMDARSEDDKQRVHLVYLSVYSHFIKYANNKSTCVWI